MADIVERLRELTPQTPEDRWRLMQDAAGEIEKLRALLRDKHRDYGAVIERLRAENATLKDLVSDLRKLKAEQERR